MSPPSETRVCPFCAEDIKLEASKCKHCGEFLDANAATPPTGGAGAQTPFAVFGCPKCGGVERQDLGGGQFRCVTRVMVDGIAPGLAGNAGMSVIPIFGECGFRYDRAAERLAADARAEATRSAERAAADAREARANAAEESRRARADDKAAADDPATSVRIRTLAAALIESRPSGCVPVVRRVEIPTLMPGKPDGTGYAVVDWAWPVGSLPWSRKEWNEGVLTGITKEGRPVMLSGTAPSVVLKPSHRWTESSMSIAPGWHASVVQRLIADSEREPTDETRPRSAPALSGKPMSSAQEMEVSRMGDKIAALGYEISRLRNLYGTPDNPDQHGRPSKSARKAFADQKKLTARQDALIAK